MTLILFATIKKLSRFLRAENVLWKPNFFCFIMKLQKSTQKEEEQKKFSCAHQLISAVIFKNCQYYIALLVWLCLKYYFARGFYKIIPDITQFLPIVHQCESYQIKTSEPLLL